MNNKNIISLKDLAALLSPIHFQRAYNNLRQQAKRGKFQSYSLIKGVGFVDINDPQVPADAKIKYLNNPETLINSGSPVYEIKQPGNLNELSIEQEKIAKAKAYFLKLYTEYSSQGISVVESKHKFIQTFNHNAFPELYKLIGKVSFKSVERWKKDYEKSGRDYRVLALKYKKEKQTSVPPEQAEVLIKLFLNPNQPPISEVVRMAMDLFQMKNHNVILSEHTYRRFIDKWSLEHYADVVFYREGEHALDDKVMPFIERDYDRIEVGDIIVADGHVLNFEIINPFTGKPKRMMLILFFDMKSSFPLGWEISPSENVLSIAVAFRRSIMRLGKYPKVVYLDNGRAFGAKYFQGNDFSEIIPLFERLNIKTITAIPYHAQSKTIERFFRSFAELERLLPTYTGTSIELQPPRLNRGEKLHTKIFEKMMHGTSLNILQAHQAVAFWFDRYTERMQQDGHLKGQRPVDLFEKGRGPGIDKKELVYLMMTDKVTTIYRNGIKILGISYWNEALFGMRCEVLVRYDLVENESIYVYDVEGQFICEAKRLDKVHPAAGILGDESDVKLLEEQLAKKQSLKSTVVGDARKFLQQEVYPAANKLLSDYNIIQLDVNNAGEVTETVTKKEKKMSKDFFKKIGNAGEPEPEANTDNFLKKLKSAEG